MNVSVIVPCYNERDFIERCILSIIKSCEVSGLYYEVLVSDGGSTDGTLDILDSLSKNYSCLSVHHNPYRLQVYALNQLIIASKGEVLIRCDAHAEYHPNYVKELYGYLIENPSVGNAGLQVKTESCDETSVSKAVSCCLSSKFGVGGSHRSFFSRNVIECDTVLFGAWRKDVFGEVGGFNTEFVRGQDLEHNLRLKKYGYRVVQLPIEGVVYYTRNSYEKLFRMMMQYASVKPMLFKYGYGIPNFRSFVPILFYATLFSLSVVDLYLALLVLLVYLLFGAVFSVLEAAKKESLLLAPCVFVGFIFQHFGHAVGMLVGCQVFWSGKTIRWGHTR